MTSLPLDKMSRAEKLMALEALWEDLTRNEREFESPSWHEQELADTEARVKSGQEKLVDWETAKNQLRQKSQ
jgi:hypothetical protein